VPKSHLTASVLRALFDRALEHPLVYRSIQAPFAEAKLEPLLRRSAGRQPHRVLDVGCGPGTNAAHFERADYTGIDINPAYIASAKRRFAGRFVVGDVTDPEVLPGQQFDCVLVNSLFHHLDDRAVHVLLGRLRERVAPGGALHVMDLVLPPVWNAARLLAVLDRGRHARPLPAWRALFTEHFEQSAFQPYPVGVPFLPLWQMVYFEGRPRTF
jgi:SAM-dependent methyltransferase